MDKRGEERPFDEWMEDIPYNETRNYVRKVMGNLLFTECSTKK